MIAVLSATGLIIGFLFTESTGIHPLVLKLLRILLDSPSLLYANKLIVYNVQLFRANRFLY